MNLKHILGAALAALALTCTTAGVADARATHHHYRHAQQSSSSDYYTNVSGHRVHRPVFRASAPSGWTARCRDGSYSFSEHHRGTCSWHGGVARWR